MIGILSRKVFGRCFGILSTAPESPVSALPQREQEGQPYVTGSCAQNFMNPLQAGQEDLSPRRGARETPRDPLHRTE